MSLASVPEAAQMNGRMDGQASVLNRMDCYALLLGVTMNM
jgi:hypothetical protein